MPERNDTMTILSEWGLDARADVDSARSQRPVSPVPGALLAIVCALLAAWPLTSVLAMGAWASATILTVVVTGVSAALLRLLLRRRGIALRLTIPPLGAGVVLIAFLLFLFFRDEALLGVLPTPAVAASAAQIAQAASTQILFGVAPLPSTPEVAVVIAAGFGALTILMDILLALRLPAVAVLMVALVGAVPAMVTGAAVDIVWFILVALVLLLLLRVRVPSLRTPTGAGRQNDSAGIRRPGTALTAGAGVLAITATLFIAPGLPVSSSGLAVGGNVVLSPSLRLGEDLRRPAPVDVLTLVTDASSPPYLRIATLSAFDGDVWSPDRTPTAPLEPGLSEESTPVEFSLGAARTSIRIVGMSSSWAPVPFPATSVRGLTGSWQAMPANRTVLSETTDAADQTYTATSAIVAPSLEQIRASSAVFSPAPEEYRSLPAEIPESIAATAQEVTAGAENDYDRLEALQSWFRSDFEYSLETPVENGFDGTGADAVATFLEQRSGYCVHFAASFALMARTLGIPTRIVVGYLPGTATEERVDDSPMYVVTSDQLHAWPESYFEGLGWIPFEPTATLGVPTRFRTEAETGSAPVTTPTSAPEETSASAPEQNQAPDRLDEDPGGDATGVSSPTSTPAPVGGIVLALIVVLLIPAGVRVVRRALRLRRAAHGDATAAWRELGDLLIDLRVPRPLGESPRALGQRLVDSRGADPAAIAVLVSAIERASYDARVPREEDGSRLSAALGKVRAQVKGRASMPERAQAFLLPRSLLPERITAAFSAS